MRLNTHKTHYRALILGLACTAQCVWAAESTSFQLYQDPLSQSETTKMESTTYRMRGGITWTNNTNLVSTSYQLQTRPPVSSGSSTSTSSSTSSSTTNGGTSNGTGFGGARGDGTTTVEVLPDLIAGSSSSQTSRSSSSARSSRSSRSSGEMYYLGMYSSEASSACDTLRCGPIILSSLSSSSRTGLGIVGSVLPLAVSPNFDQIDPDSSSSSSMSSDLSSETSSSNSSSDSSSSSANGSDTQSSQGSSDDMRSSARSSAQSSQASSVRAEPLLTQIEQRVLNSNVVVTVRGALETARMTISNLLKPRLTHSAPKTTANTQELIPFDAPIPASLLPWVIAMISLQTLLMAAFMYVFHRRVAREVLHRLMRRR